MKEFKELTKEVISEALSKKINLVDWDFVLNGEDMQIFKAGDSYCHTIGGKSEFTNDMYFYPLSMDKSDVGPEECRPFSDPDLAPRWKVEIEPHCGFKTKWGETSMRSGISATIYRNNVAFGIRHGFTLDEAYIAASYTIRQLKGHPISLHDRNWKDQLVGRKIYYDNQPAIIESVNIYPSSFDNEYPLKVVPDKEKIDSFRPQGHWSEEEESDLWEYGDSSYTSLLDPKIWWFRE